MPWARRRISTIEVSTSSEASASSARDWSGSALRASPSSTDSATRCCWAPSLRIPLDPAPLFVGGSRQPRPGRGEFSGARQTVPRGPAAPRHCSTITSRWNACTGTAPTMNATPTHRGAAASAAAAGMKRALMDIHGHREHANPVMTVKTRPCCQRMWGSAKTTGTSATSTITGRRPGKTKVTIEVAIRFRYRPM